MKNCQFLQNTELLASGKYSRGERSSPRFPKSNDRTKRQERVGHVIRTEIATILQLGYPIKTQKDVIEDDLRRRINVVNADVSPDLRQARVTISVIKPSKKILDEIEENFDDDEFDDDLIDDEDEDFDDEEEDDDDMIDDDEEEDDGIIYREVFAAGNAGNSNSQAVIDRRRAYAWLVKNTKPIRHALSQRLRHMKSIPDLTFIQADVGAAVDVMNLIEKVNKSDYKRQNIGLFGGDDDNLPDGMYLGDEEDDGWIDEDNDEDDFDWDEEYGEEGDDMEEEEVDDYKNTRDKKRR